MRFTHEATLRNHAHIPGALMAGVLLSITTGCWFYTIDPTPTGSTPRPSAVAVLYRADGEALDGHLLFEQRSEHVSVQVYVETGDTLGHALIVHETGDCTGAGFPAVGPHFNPHGSEHGCPGEEERHAGDLGTTFYEEGAIQGMDAPGATLVDGPASIIGRSVVLYAEPDRCVAPEGDGGARIACGVIAWE